jgi:UDP-N-acetyl-D-mannosaminuronic acid dehydrogenase
MTVGGAVAVVGLGRVGLPFALYLAERGHQVIGIDRDQQLLEKLRRGEMPFLDHGASDVLPRHLGRSLLVGDRIEACAGAQTVVVALGTLLDKHMSPTSLMLHDVVLAIAGHLQRGALLVLRGTTAPGTTETLARRICESRGWTAGQDYHLAFCPERIAEGFSLVELPEIPQIVGGVDARSAERAADFFRPISSAVLVSDARSAELAKLFCNAYRYADFAVANEFMMIAEGHDRSIHEVLRLANEGYKRGGLKRPGFTGGPCLFKDGLFLTSGSPFADLLSIAWKVNESVPVFLVDRLRLLFPELRGVAAVMGLAFKRDIDDTRHSLAFKLRRLLLQEGFRVVVHDPFVTGGDAAPVLAEANVVFFAMNHDSYAMLGRAGLKEQLRPGTLVCDVWNLYGVGRTYFRREEL